MKGGKSSFYRSARIRIVLAAILFFVAAPPASAITLDRTTYTLGDPSPLIIAPDGSGPVALYDLNNSDTPIFDLAGLDPGANINYFGIAAGSYSIVELSSYDIPCYAYAQSYNDCKAAPEFVSEFLFTVVSPQSGGGAGGEPVPEVNAPAGGIAQYAPEIEISAPKAGDVLSRAGTISYKATDRNDGGAPKEKELYGLAQDPVTLFYSDALAEWDSGRSIGRADKMLIATSQPAEASYAWDASALVPGIFYRIIADVADVAGAFAETASELFTVDFSAPTFIVKADPPATQGKDVTVSIDASEHLKEPPTVIVTQAGATAATLSMAGEGSYYKGTYAVIKGHDGIATITVSGKDAAGNVGTAIVSGGTFAVGVNPPPAPRISSPRDNAVVGTSTVAVTGSARSDTTVTLTVNGTDEYAASSSPDGSFAISGIRLSKDMNRGENVLSVSARDRAGLSSEAAPIRVKYNIAPTVAVSSPAENASVGATTALTARAADENGDSLAFTYEIIPAGESAAARAATSTESAWRVVGDAIPTASFSWDSTEAEDGQYFLRVVADDGIEKAYSAPVAFSVRNTLPFFRFEDGRKTLTNQRSVTVVGRALAPESVSPLSAIAKVEYSVDNGKKWNPVSLASGGGTPAARFTATFDGLAEGTKSVLWRVKDSRNFYGRASHPIIVDTTAPRAPLVDRPSGNAFITGADDEDASRSGLQISVAGTAEPQSVVTLRAPDATMTTKAMPDGRFTFRSVDIPRRGPNRLEVTAADGAGNTSAAAVSNVMYDNPPVATILAPKPFRGLTGKALASWSVSDADGDPIRSIALEYRRGQGAFTALPIRQDAHSFAFDVSALPEAADYQLRLSASDGIATGTDLVRFSVDNSPPTLSSFSLDAPTLGENGVLRAHGEARDALSGIEYVEYAVSEGGVEPESFTTALLTSGFLQGSATFAIKHPEPLADGAYIIYARAVDAAGNVSRPLSRAFVVDTSPPRIGSFSASSQGTRIAPDEHGSISLYSGAKALFEISLEGDTDAASLLVGSTSIPLAKDIASGLWRATIDTGAVGTTTLALSAEDNMHNAFTNKPIGALVASERPAAAPGQPARSAARAVWEFLQSAIRRILAL